jgi:hypothetical protein
MMNLAFLQQKVLFQMPMIYTAISIKVVPEQSGKVEYERERLRESLKN